MPFEKQMFLKQTELSKAGIQAHVYNNRWVKSRVAVFLVRLLTHGCEKLIPHLHVHDGFAQGTHGGLDI